MLETLLFCIIIILVTGLFCICSCLIDIYNSIIYMTTGLADVLKERK